MAGIPAEDPYARPSGADDATVEAVGKVTEALEWIERARGKLYDAHQLIGHGDALLGEAADALDAAGHGDFARRVRTDLVGRNVIEGRWTFQVVDEFDDLYWTPFRDIEREIRERLTGGRRHVYEAEMKERRRTLGHPAHNARPAPPDGH
jgi:hypothetical protein